MPMNSDAVDHATQIAERTFADLDWSWFDQFYEAHDGPNYRGERAALLDQMQLIFLDELVWHCAQLKGGGRAQ